MHLFISCIYRKLETTVRKKLQKEMQKIGFHEFEENKTP